FESLDKIVKSLGWIDPTNRQYVSARRQPQDRQNIRLRRGPRGWRRGAVAYGDKALPAWRIASREPLLDVAADADHIIGEARNHPFAGPEKPPAHAAPFYPVIVLGVMGRDHAEAQQPRQRREEAWPNPVQVNDVWVKKQARIKDRQRRMHQRLDPLAPRRPNGNHTHIANPPAPHIPTAPDHHDVQLGIEPGQSRIEMLAVRFDPAH